MSNATYLNGLVSVGTTAVKLCTVSQDNNCGVLVNNAGSVVVYLGGPSVTASGGTGGLPVAAAATVLVPTAGGQYQDLYAIAASSTANVTFLQPS